MAECSLSTGTMVLPEAAQAKLFTSEIHPALQRLALPLQRMVSRLDRPWWPWFTHAATAAVASLMTSAVFLYLAAP